MKLKICVVIVTYNRCKLLRRCLDSVLMQSRLPDCVLVVDNCSSDGTKEYLENLESFDLTTKVRAIHLDKNLGGAGGFYCGMKYAVDNKFDYVWLMDDDGYPNDNSLELLLKHASQHRIVGPIVSISPTDKHLSFPFRIPGTIRFVDSLSQFKHRYPLLANNVIFPFNGTLISKQVIETIGLPRAEYFIWGDEAEYVYRARRAKFETATVTDAKFYHPRGLTNAQPMFFNLLLFNEPKQDIKLLCLVRNSIRNYLDYRSVFHAFGFACKVLWFYVFTHPNLSRLKLTILGISDAIAKNFERHKEFL